MDGLVHSTQGLALLKKIYILQWNLDLTKGLEVGKMCSLYRGFFFIDLAVTGVKKIVRYTEDFVT